MRTVLLVLAFLVLVGGGILGAMSPRALPLPLLAALCLVILWWYKDEPKSHR